MWPLAENDVIMTKLKDKYYAIDIKMENWINYYNF